MSGIHKPTGGFKKGCSGNPNGRPKVDPEVRELAKTHTTAAITTLAEIMGNPDAPPSARITAAENLLNRAWGRPESTTTLNVNQNREVTQLSNDELIAIITGAAGSGAGNAASAAGAGEPAALH